MATYTEPRILKRAAIAVIGVALACSFLVPASFARAQTSAELQAQINQLLAVIAQLQAQLNGGATASGSCPAGLWTRDLGNGSSGADVLALQRFLNSSADTRLAASGAGSPGMETQYYGPITAAAVSKFQVKYRAAVLTPLGLANPTGYFGASSRAKANALCAATTPTTPGNNGNNNNNGATLNGGEASLEDFDAQSGDDTDVNEGDDEARVMDVSFDVEDGDVRVNRIDVGVDHISGGDDDPWDVFDRIAILVDGKVIADEDVTDEDDWSEDEPNNGDYTFRFTDLDNYVVREGDTGEFTVAFTVASSVDDADTGVTWETFIPDDGIRATDGVNINHYTGDTSDTVSFDIDEAGSDDDLMVRSSSDDPDATTLQLDDNDRSDWITVFAFDLDAKNSNDDIEVQSLPIDLTFSSSTYNTLVRDTRLMVDGDEVGDVEVTNGGTDNPTLTFDFDRDEFMVNEGDRVTVELQLEFNALDNSLEGTTLYSTVDGDDIEAEGADDLGTDQLGGSATSETHTLRTDGATLDNVSTTETVRESDTGADTGTYTIKFDVTAFNSDVYVNRTAASGTTLGTAGVNYVVEDSSGDQVGGGSSSAALSSTAPVEGSRYRVAEGQTETFTLSVSYVPASDDFYRVQLYSINWNDTNNDPDTMQRALPAQDYETDYESLDS